MRLLSTTFSFDGPSATQTTAIDATPGADLIDADAEWRTNGLKGGFDISAKVPCPSAPSFSIEKLQKIAGRNDEYTSSPLSGQVGQTVDYEILVTNTGNVPLTLGFTDPNCDPGTLSGGPGSEALAVGASTTYLCTHLLDRADETAGSY